MSLISLALPPLLGVFGWMNHHPEHPLARVLLGLGYCFQRWTVAEPEAAWLARQGLEVSA